MQDSSSPDFVTALARGIDVLGCFDGDHRRMNLSQVAERVGLSRGTTRRFLLTLESLGLLESDGKLFWMTSKVLRFANAYLSAFGLGDAAKAVLRRLAEDVLESASMSVLDGGVITYVARADPPRRLASAVGLHIGSQLPAHCASMGRVLLAAMDDEALQDWLRRHPLEPVTERTLTDPVAWRAEIAQIRQNGYAILDGEMETGVRSLAVPVRDRTGRTIAAVNVATLTGRTSLAELRKTFLPALRRTAEEIAHLMEHR
ncbi:MAG: helix-turn-helix domain-containing protein [Bosea sp.]|uniref:IclR family transcriptional regulator domain-containing protein n=1 Tax=Bosea sp. (in: a-proteobacteria) TaxID=1871050 RepID=UPI0010F6CB4F|nr:helix-turn-helix domain-containing protein [Bosea sp. (in: a-proteobacteria)]MCP4734843.1 helix-turn-helix domain-containing protein [Bosea sp. (in: a-proteobacteria)]